MDLAAQGLHGFFAAQGLQGFFAAQGLQGLQAFLAAQGLQGLQAFLAAHGEQPAYAELGSAVTPAAMLPRPTASPSMTGMMVVEDRSRPLCEVLFFISTLLDVTNS